MLFPSRLEHGLAPVGKRQPFPVCWCTQHAFKAVWNMLLFFHRIKIIVPAFDIKDVSRGDQAARSAVPAAVGMAFAEQLFYSP